MEVKKRRVYCDIDEVQARGDKYMIISRNRDGSEERERM